MSESVFESLNRLELAANMASNAAVRLRERSEIELVLPGIGRIERGFLADAFEAYARALEERAWKMKHGDLLDEAAEANAPPPAAEADTPPPAPARRARKEA